MKSLVLTAVVVLFGLLVLGGKAAKREKEAEEQYYREHPLTAVQLEASVHFAKCWRYRQLSASQASDLERKAALLREGCYSDDRDDPHVSEAAYPWNELAPHPWKG